MNTSQFQRYLTNEELGILAHAISAYLMHSPVTPPQAAKEIGLRLRREAEHRSQRAVHTAAKE